MKISEIDRSEQKITRLKEFVEWVCDSIGCEDRPTVNYGTDLAKVKKLRTFGSTNSNGDIWVHVNNRNLADTMRTLAHELIHFKQFEDGTASDDMDDDQRQSIEDEANALAGRLMRAYGKKHEDIYENKRSGRSAL
jgi:Zn-dependent peptidase ImmA (M78 family)